MSAPRSDEEAIRRTIRALRAAGYVLLHVDDGGEEVKVETETEAIEAITAVSCAHLWVAEGTPTGMRGWIFFVLGNEPEEVICDHTISLSRVLDPLTERWGSDD